MGREDWPKHKTPSPEAPLRHWGVFAQIWVTQGKRFGEVGPEKASVQFGRWEQPGGPRTRWAHPGGSAIYMSRSAWDELRVSFEAQGAHIVEARRA